MFIYLGVLVGWLFFKDYSKIVIKSTSLSSSPLQDSSQKRNGLGDAVWNLMKYPTTTAIQQSNNRHRSTSKRKGVQKVNVLEASK